MQDKAKSELFGKHVHVTLVTVGRGEKGGGRRGGIATMQLVTMIAFFINNFVVVLAD